MSSSVCIWSRKTVSSPMSIWSRKARQAVKDDDIITLTQLLNEEEFRRVVAGKDWSITYGTCPLHTAVYLGRDELVRLMVAGGISINSYSIDVNAMVIWTPLHCAAYHAKVSTLKLLLELGAEEDLLTKELTSSNLK